MDIGPRMSDDTVSADPDGIHVLSSVMLILGDDFFSKALPVAFVVGYVAFILSCHQR